MKGHHRRGNPELTRKILGPADHRLVAPMDAVEIADRQHRRRIRRTRFQRICELHRFHLLHPFRNTFSGRAMSGADNRYRAQNAPSSV